MISVKQTNNLLNYVEQRMQSSIGESAYKELFEVRSRLNDILSEHYVKRNRKKYKKN